MVSRLPCRLTDTNRLCPSQITSTGQNWGRTGGGGASGPGRVHTLQWQPGAALRGVGSGNNQQTNHKPRAALGAGRGGGAEVPRGGTMVPCLPCRLTNTNKLWPSQISTRAQISPGQHWEQDGGGGGGGAQGRHSKEGVTSTGLELDKNAKRFSY